MPSGRDSFRRNRVAPFVLFYFTTPGVTGPFPACFVYAPPTRVTSSYSFCHTIVFFQ